MSGHEGVRKLISQCFLLTPPTFRDSGTVPVHAPNEEWLARKKAKVVTRKKITKRQPSLKPEAADGDDEAATKQPSEEADAPQDGAGGAATGEPGAAGEPGQE